MNFIPTVITKDAPSSFFSEAKRNKIIADQTR